MCPKSHLSFCGLNYAELSCDFFLIKREFYILLEAVDML